VTTDKIETDFRCGFCEKVFRRETSLAVHLCEQKQRFQNREDPGVRMGFQAYLRFYETQQGSSRLKTYDDFARSAYYRAFVKFGRYCISINAINPARFLDWLLDKNKKVDHWCRDSIYSEYLHDYMRKEAASDALYRTMETAIKWSENTQHPVRDYLRFGNNNAICYAVTSGHVSPWALYNCESGQCLLDHLNPEQVSMIWSWIDPEFWQKKFRDYPADREYAREVLAAAGW